MKKTRSPEIEQAIKEASIERLKDFGFGLTEISRYGMTPEQLNAECASMIEQGLATEETVHDKFYEIYTSYYKSVPVKTFDAKTAASFGDRKTVYVWYPRIVRQEVNVLMCAGGTGKTYAVCLIAADVSQGKALPGDLKPQSGGETCLLISGEDTGELLKERLKACGADLDKVFILDCHDSTGLNFGARWEEFQEVVMKYKPALTVIDPLQSFIGEEADLNKVNVIRPIMQRLANIAKTANTAILLISHVNKKSQTDNLNNAASGSTDFINASRSAMYIIFDEQDDDSRLLIHSKSNYAPAGKTVRFTFNNAGGIYWNGYSDIDRFTVEEAARRRKTPGEIVKANAYQAETNDLLIRALLEVADPDRTVKFSYDSFKERFGGDIFGTQQPKRALDSVVCALSDRGWILETGKRVREGVASLNGFTITEKNVHETDEQLEIVHDL